jgi:hypothetical protein
MKEQLQELENESSGETDGACLIIECSSDGEVSFSCDWQLGEEGITCMATILVSLDDDQLAPKIINSIEENYESEEDKYKAQQLNAFYKALKKITNQYKEREDGEIVVSPLDASLLV